MKYAIIIMNAGGPATGSAEAEAWTKDVFAWYEKWGAAGKLLDGGAELDDASKAKTVRSSGVTDGPYIEAKEVIGGFSVLEADTIDEAVEIATTWPGVDRGWITVEVRPVYERTQQT